MTTFGARSIPPGASLNAESGWNEILWDHRQDENKEVQWNYGYVRPSLQLSTSGVVNGFETEFAIYPVSFFKFSGVYSQSHRATQFDKVNCQSVGCQGWLGKVGLLSELKLGAGPWFLGASVKLDQIDSSNTDHPEGKFLDENSMLLGSSKKDLTRIAQIFAGYQLSDLWKLGVFCAKTQMGGTGETSYQVGSFAIWEINAWKVWTGLNHYKSPLYAGSMSVFFQASYAFLPGIGL